MALGSPGAGVPDSCEPPDMGGYWELNLGPPRRATSALKYQDISPVPSQFSLACQNSGLSLPPATGLL